MVLRLHLLRGQEPPHFEGPFSTGPPGPAYLDSPARGGPGRECKEGLSWEGSGGDRRTVLDSDGDAAVLGVQEGAVCGRLFQQGLCAPGGGGMDRGWVQGP